MSTQLPVSNFLEKLPRRELTAVDSASTDDSDNPDDRRKR